MLRLLVSKTAEGMHIVKTHTVQRAITVFTAIALLAVTPANTFAATSKSSTPSASSVSTQTNVLSISPVRTDVTIAPGTSAQIKLYVSNITKTAIAVQPIENDFVAGPKENGEPAIILSPSQYAPTHSLKRFMDPLPASVTVPAVQRSLVTLTIAVPKTAQAGGYYGAVRFAPVNTSGNANLNLSESVASIILMTVPGPTTEEVGITNFDIQQYGSTGTNFRNGKGLQLFLRFENKGNVQEAPFGQIYIQKGKKVTYSYNFNNADVTGARQEILPDTSRRWTVPLSGFGSFGKYTIGGVFTYGTNSQHSLDVTKTVWIIPTVLIFAVAGGVLGLIALIVIIWLLLRSYKKRLLRHYRR